MAKQATSFRSVDTPVQEASVRPIFPLLGAVSDEPTHIAATGSVVDATPSVNVRPPKGTLWELVYCMSRLSAYASPTAGKSVYVNISLVVSGVEYLIKTMKITQGDGQTYDDVITELSLSVDTPLSFDRYIKIGATHDGMTAGATVTWVGLAFVRPI